MIHIDVTLDDKRIITTDERDGLFTVWIVDILNGDRVTEKWTQIQMAAVLFTAIADEDDGSKYHGLKFPAVEDIAYAACERVPKHISPLV